MDSVLQNGEKAITIDFHRGCLMLTTSSRVLLWNVQSGAFRKGVIANETVQTIARTDFVLEHGENLDTRYLQVMKRPGQIILIGTHTQQDEIIHHIWHRRRRPEIIHRHREAQQRVVWINDGSVEARAAAPEEDKQMQEEVKQAAPVRKGDQKAHRWSV